MMKLRLLLLAVFFASCRTTGSFPISGAIISTGFNPEGIANAHAGSQRMNSPYKNGGNTSPEAKSET